MFLDELTKVTENFNNIKLENNSNNFAVKNNNNNTAKSVAFNNNNNYNTSFPTGQSTQTIQQINSSVNLPVVKNEDNWNIINNNNNSQLNSSVNNAGNPSNQFIANFNSSKSNTQGVLENPKIQSVLENNRSFDAALSNNNKKSNNFEFSENKFDNKFETFDKLDQGFNNDFGNVSSRANPNIQGANANSNLSYPQFNAMPNPIANETAQSQPIKSQPVQTEVNPSASANVNRINTDFDFDGGFDGGFDGMGTFKEFAEKKGDDIFKKADFDVNWDNF
jgi:hypothetical protein